MKQFAILFALLAMPAVVGGCSSSDAKSASNKKPKKKGKKDDRYTVDPHGKNYRAPQNVFGPTMLEEHQKNLKDSDPKERALACVGLFNLRGRARDALPELKRMAKSDKDKNVREQARRAIKAIEEG